MIPDNMVIVAHPNRFVKSFSQKTENYFPEGRERMETGLPGAGGRRPLAGGGCLFRLGMPDKKRPGPARLPVRAVNKHAQISFWAATRATAPYFSRSLGFSILPVGLRGTSAKMILWGRLYFGSFMQNSLTSSSVRV